MNGRMALKTEREQNVCFLPMGTDAPVGKVFAVPRAEPRKAPTADMEVR